MVAKIQPANDNVAGTMRYNEKKNGLSSGEEMEAVVYNETKVKEGLSATEDGELCHVVATENVPEGSSLEKEFTKRLDANRRKGRTKLPAFHMSVNPGENDRKLTDGEAREFIGKIMRELGYGDQPYRIYKHTDIERAHYHVVSIRVDGEGRKIKDGNEHKRLQNILKRLEKDYGYKLGRGDGEENSETKEAEGEKKEERKPAGKEKEEKGTAEKPRYVPRFSPKRPNISQQFRDILEDSLRWHFATMNEYRTMLEMNYGIRMQTEDIAGNDMNTFIVHGLTSGGRRCTNALSESDLGLRIYDRIKKRAEETDMRRKKREAERTKNIIAFAAKNAKDYEDFKRLLNLKAVRFSVSWTRGGKPFGVTWTDRSTRCVWKGSELDRGLDFILRSAEKWGAVLTPPPLENNPDKAKVRRKVTKTDFEDRSRLTPEERKAAMSAAEAKKEAEEAERTSRGALQSLAGDANGHERDGLDVTIVAGGGRGGVIWEDEAKKHFQIPTL